ncbi:MAG: hypothetical protein ACK40L_08540 [Hydrogenophaga sp.]
MAQPVTVNDAHRQYAWERIRQPSWPSTLEATLQDATRRKLVEALATQLAHAEGRVMSKQASAPAQLHQAQPTRPAQSPWLRRQADRPAPAVPQGCIDRKRAAAGDFDSD